MDMQIVQDGGGHCALVIPEVFDQDEGVYTVRAENSAGEATCQAQLVVKRKDMASFHRIIASSSPPSLLVVSYVPVILASLLLPSSTASLMSDR